MTRRHDDSGLSRRAWLGRVRRAAGLAALSGLLPAEAAARSVGAPQLASLHHAPRARRAIYLFQSGGPSHVDLFDHKPGLPSLHGTDLPPSVKGDQRVTGMTSGQASFRVNAPIRPFRRHGACGRWISDLLPHTAGVVDDLCILKAVHTEAINHDPGITFINTGSQQLGRPSLGAWLSHGLGTANRDLPAYVVLLSQGNGKKPGQPIFERLWGSGFLPSQHQGVRLRPGRDPVLHLSNPDGIDRAMRRGMLDDLAALNGRHLDVTGDPETAARVYQYELAYRMQRSVPALTDLSDEPDSTFELYGEDARIPGTYAANCLLSRRMMERGVRFVQLFHRGWDQHRALRRNLTAQCEDTDRASAALVIDLKRRGLLDDTLVVWGGEFGRTVYSQGALDAGRDHHGRCFSMWVAGGGVRPGIEYGRTDDFAYNVVSRGVHIQDLNATILHCLGIDHERLTHRHQGLDQRLTGVEARRVVREILQ